MRLSQLIGQRFKQRPAVHQIAETLYTDLSTVGYEALLDDRSGVQFFNADLLGAPLRIILSKRNLESQEVEWKRRDTGKSGRLPMREILVEGKLNEAFAGSPLQ